MMWAPIAALRRLALLSILPAMRFGPLYVLAILSLGLAACDGGPPRAAAESAHQLLGSVLAGDRAGFETRIDRRAIREDLRRQMTELARADTLDVDGGPSEFALDRMIGPGALRLVRAGSGQALTAAPSARELGHLLKVLDRQRVCLPDAPSGGCALTFAKAHNQWLLVGMRAMNPIIALADGKG